MSACASPSTHRYTSTAVAWRLRPERLPLSLPPSCSPLVIRHSRMRSVRASIPLDARIWTNIATVSETPLWENGMTFHHLGLWISAGFGIFSVIVALLLVFTHATHYSKPWEQRQ